MSQLVQVDNRGAVSTAIAGLRTKRGTVDEVRRLISNCEYGYHLDICPDFLLTGTFGKLNRTVDFRFNYLII